MTNTPAPQEVVQALRDALACALDNLPDVAGDPIFGSRAIVECCADIAALHQLLAVPYEQAAVPTEQQVPNIVAYLAQ